jgi:ribosomal protein L14
LKGIIIRSKFFIKNNDGNSFCFKTNNVVLLKKRLTPRGKSIAGPIIKKIKRKKFISSFAGAL